MYIMQVLAISEKWSEKHGYDCEDVIFMNYMKTKNYILAMVETKEEKKEFGNTNNLCTSKDIIRLYREMNNNNFNIMIGKRYFFQERMFCKRNKSFENFIRKTKKYFSNKIKNKKIKDEEWVVF